jgi:hypothetical protein
MRPGPSCHHRRQELFIAGTEPEAVCTYHHSQEPWHRMPTRFAGWLHDRFEHRGAGRYRLAGFDTDLERTFGEPERAQTHQEISQGRPGLTSQPSPDAARGQENHREKLHGQRLRSTVNSSSLTIPLSPPGERVRVRGGSDQPSNQNNSLNKKLSFGRNQTVYLHNTLFPALAAGQDPQIAITSPLNGDRFLLAPGEDSVALSLKAACRAPFPQVTWFIDGREYAATGPPYELSLPLGRGRHRLAVIGPDGLGDNLEVSVE